MPDYYRRNMCRACGSSDLAEILDLGDMPPANYFCEAGLFVPRYPLTLVFCRACTLVQTPDVVDPNILFKDYIYTSGSSKPLADHFIKYAEDEIIPHLEPTDTVIDIGGNDGIILKHVKHHCGVTVNIDPSATGGQHIVPELFDSELAKYVRNAFGPAKVITANNVLAHVNDPFDFVRGVRHLLADDGIFICEVHWALNLLRHVGYDQIYHEHLSYFSINALSKMMETAELPIFNIEFVTTHGGSLRVFASHDKPTPRAVSPLPIVTERNFGDQIHTEKGWKEFAERVEVHRNVLRDLIFDLADGASRIFAYGAPAKGSTLLNYCGIDFRSIEYAVDGAPTKQGKNIPGTGIPVVTPNRLLHDTPEYALLLAWNYKDHILAKEKVLRDRGTKFITPFPTVTIE